MTSIVHALRSMLPFEFRQRLKRRLFKVNDMATRLANLRRAGFACSGAIDGGAYEGEWTKELWTVYPGIPCLLVEPIPVKRPVLEHLAKAAAGSVVVEAALGREPGRTNFRLGETNSGVAAMASSSPGLEIISVDLTTLDTLLDHCRNFSPNLLKLDLQGFELECLKGCTALADQFEVVILEVSVIPLGGAPRFSEVDRFMQEEGYVLYDIIPQHYRPLDGALWQCDAFYVRLDSSLVQSLEWK